MAQPQGRTDLGLEMLGARKMQCLACLFEDTVSEFGRTITSRGGLTVIHCECPTCMARWRRIDVGTIQ